MTDKLLAEIKAGYEAGLTLREVAECVGISTTKVRYALVRAGVKARGRGPSRPLDVDLLKRLYATGRTLSQIARKFRCSSELVRFRLIEAGVELRPRFRVTQSKPARLVKDTGPVAKRIEPEVVAKALGAEPTPRRRGGPPRRFDHDEAIRLYAEGWSLNELCARYGVREHSVRQSLIRAGVERRGRGSLGLLHTTLDALLADGLVTVDAQGRYSLTEAGREQAPA